jgi:lipase (class 3)
MAREFTEVQQMLCLAALTYRDFADVGPPAVHERRLVDDMTLRLREVAPLQGQWSLVWGPSTYRAPLSLFDDVAMYVVRSNSHPEHYVVAVRGTNPLSGFDWLFGDLWVSGQTPWPFDHTGAARISLSTALGLDILLQLRASSQPTGPAAAIWQHVERRLADFASTIKKLVAKPLSMASVTPVRARVAEMLAGVAAGRRGRNLQDRATQLSSLQNEWSAALREQLINEVAAGLTTLGGEPSLHLLTLLEKEASVSARLAGGYDLVSFLKAAVESTHGSVRIVVTGHSKGGALAPTLALWLTDTQGSAAEAQRWDPEGRASVDCYSFAGPTAGNDAFAQRSNQVIGDRCHRIYNRLDVVAKAWVPGSLRGIGSLYEPDVPSIPGLASLVGKIADVVDTQHLEYTHIGNHVLELPGTIDPHHTDFFSQFVHQHLQAYLDQMGIGDVVNVGTFFGL